MASPATHALTDDSGQAVTLSSVDTEPFAGLTPDPAALPTVPGHVVVRLVGRGDTGRVYEARHVGLGRTVALKLLNHAADEPLSARFRAEARAVARLGHLNVARLFETGVAEGQPSYAQEFLGGGSLAEKFAGTPQPPASAAPRVETVGRGVHHSHAHGVVHRDLMPANVMLAAGGTPKVVDFGLAKLAPPVAPVASASPGGLTRTGGVLGTPSYVAPEQALVVVAAHGRRPGQCLPRRRSNAALAPERRRGGRGDAVTPEAGDSGLDAIPTQWSLFRGAHATGGPSSAVAARQALVACSARAIRRHVGGLVRSGDDADELAREVVVRLMKGDFGGADPDRGRFRDLLQAAVRNRTRDHWARANRRKGSDADSGGLAADPARDEEWRRTVLDHAWAALESHERANPKPPKFTRLKLRVESPDASSEDLTATTETRVRADACRQWLRRARLRFAEALVAELRAGLPTPPRHGSRRSWPRCPTAAATCALEDFLRRSM